MQLRLLRLIQRVHDVHRSLTERLPVRVEADFDKRHELQDTKPDVVLPKMRSTRWPNHERISLTGYGYYDDALQNVVMLQQNTVKLTFNAPSVSPGVSTKSHIAKRFLFADEICVERFSIAPGNCSMPDRNGLCLMVARPCAKNALDTPPEIQNAQCTLKVSRFLPQEMNVKLLVSIATLSLYNILCEFVSTNNY